MTKINTSSIIGSREIYESEEFPLTKTQLFHRIKTGEFPKPMKMNNSFFWLRLEVEEFFRLSTK